MKVDNSKQRLVSVSSPAIEFDFMDLWTLLVQRKIAVISVAIATFLIIILNSHFNSSSPIYQVRAILAPPTESDLDGTNREINKVFIAFEQALMSRALRIRYFNNNNLIEQFEIDHNFDNEYVFEQQFNKMLSVKRIGERKIVSFKATDTRVAAEWVNGFIEMVNEDVVRELIQDDLNATEQKIENYKKVIEKLKKVIDDRKNVANFERTLDEIALIFKMIGIQAEANIMLNRQIDNPFFLFMKNNLRQNYSQNEVIETINKLQLTIKDMNFNPLFIEKTIEDLELMLKDLISVLEELETTRPDFSHVSAMNFVHKATISAQPLNKPDVKMILLTAVLSSLVLGMLAGFFTDFLVRARKRRDSSSLINM